MVAVRLSRPLSLFVPFAVLLALGGCGKVCGDDGFAWQQDPSCVPLVSDSATDGPTSDDESASDPTEPTDSDPTSGEGGSYCADKDGDGFGDPGDCTDVPPGDEPPSGTVPNGDDCDDASETTFPGAAPKDDEEACMADADGDDYGDDNPDGGGGGVVPGSDCDDTSADTFKGAAPNDDPDACMKDADGDDWGDSDPPNGGGGGGVMPGTDCDDGNMNAWKACGTCADADGDGWFSDCDSYPPEFPSADCDDGDVNTFPGAAPNDSADACMTDADGDDWGDDKPSSPDAEPGTDCDDSSANTFPGAAMLDSADACMQDEDGDDHGDADPDGDGVIAGSDCNDGNPNINPTDSVLITAPKNSGDISEVDVDTGTVTPLVTLDVGAIIPWLPTSLAIHPDGSIYAALLAQDSLVTMNYCGGGAPTALPMQHNKSLCGIAFAGDGVLYGIDGQVDQLVTFKADGSIDNVKPLKFEGATLNVADCGMSFDCHAQRLLISDSGSGGIYTVDTTDGSTTRLADVQDAEFGSGLAYDPSSKQALSCSGTSFVSIALDGSNDVTALPDLSEAADDLDFAPGCE